MALQEDFNQIIDYAHFLGTGLLIGEKCKEYTRNSPDSFSVLTPFGVFLFGRTD
mgnify:CR=1 FL=1